MNFDLDLFLRALGLALVLEGIIWVLFPRHMCKALITLLKSGSHQLQLLGLLALIAGLAIIWLARYIKV